MPKTEQQKRDDMIAKELRVIAAIRDLDSESKRRVICYIKRRVQTGQLADLMIEVLDLLMD